MQGSRSKPSPLTSSSSKSTVRGSSPKADVRKPPPQLAPLSQSREKIVVPKDRKDDTTSSISEGKSASVYRKRLPARLSMGEEKDESYSIRFSPDSQFVVAGGGDGGIRVYNSTTGRLVYHLLSNDDLPVTCLRFRPNTQYVSTKNILISANAAGTLRHWHITSGKCVHTITEEGNQIYAVDYSSDAELFATAGKDFKVRLYDENKRVLASTLAGGHGDVTAGHASRVFSLKFNPTDTNILISGGWDNTIQIWDTRVSHAVRSIFGPHICGDAVDIYGNVVLSGSWRPDNALQLWDFGTGKLIETLDWRLGAGEEPCLLYAAQFSKGNNAEFIVAGGSGANEAKIFNRKSRQIVGELHGFKKGVYSLDFSADSKMLIVGGTGLLQLYELHLSDS